VCEKCFLRKKAQIAARQGVGEDLDQSAGEEITKPRSLPEYKKEQPSPSS